MKYTNDFDFGLASVSSGKRNAWPKISEILKKKYGKSYVEARKKAFDTGSHVMEILVKMEVCDYEDLKKICTVAGIETFGKGKVVTDSTSKLDYDSENGRFVYAGREVVPVVIPTEVFDFPQFVIRYDERSDVKKMFGQSAEESQDEDESLDFTFEDVVIRAMEENVSDVHVTFDDDYYYVSFRKDGSLVRIDDYIMNKRQGEEFVHKMAVRAGRDTMGKFNPENKVTAQDARIRYQDLRGYSVDVRLAFIPNGKLEGVNVVARLLRSESITNAVDLTEKGYDEKSVSFINRAKRRRNGLFIVSGITGSGKSTLISSVISTLSSDLRIFTIEDPIEYKLSGSNISQLQIYEPQEDKEQKLKMGFLEYVKALKRADPDVVMIGEMRNNPELIAAVIEMSKAGQLIFSTVHIPSAFTIYDSLNQVFGIDLRTTIDIVLFSLNQTLTKRLCPHCRIEDGEHLNRKRIKESMSEFPYVYKKPLEDFLQDDGITWIRNEKGCDKCVNGFAPGRVPIYEYFYPTAEMMEELHGKRDSINKTFVERYVCENGLGINKLSCYVERLKNGDVDTSPEIITKLM